MNRRLPAARRLSPPALALALLATAAAAAGATPPAPTPAAATPLDAFLAGVRRTILPNGLTLLTREQPGLGVVAIDTWVEAGYFHEPDEVAGMAHLFEHMFFKGSERFPGAEQIARELAVLGGQSNAGTSYDSTNYYFVVPREGFARAVEIQADAVAHPLFAAEELRKESEVVIEESNRKLDNPPAVSLERMLATAFTAHRIKRWRIGSNEVLRNIRRDDLLAFFETLYRPENLIVAIAGDVTHAEAEAVVRRTFGALPAGRLDKHGGPAEPPQREFRYGRSSADLKQGYSVLGWHTQGVGGADELALDLLAAILGQGRSSRLFRNVVGAGAAATATAFHLQYEDVGMLAVQASFDEANRGEVDRRILAEVERLRGHGPAEAELRVAKNGLESGLVLGLEDALGQAVTLAQSEARYGYRSLGERLAALQAVSVEQVRDAARRHLTVDGLTLYHYAPAGAPELGREQALAAVRAAVAAAPPALDLAALPPAPAAVPAARADRPARAIQLRNGATLVVRERPGAPSVSLGVYFRGGRAEETSGNAGITQLMASSLRRGTARRSGEQIDREIELLGTQFGLDVGPDSFGLALDVLARNARPALELLADVILHPVFPAEGVAEERGLQLAGIRRSFDSSTQRPMALALRDLWMTHAYGLPGPGYEGSVAGLDGAALESWWRQHVTAEDALVLVVGDVDAAAAQALVEEALAELPRRGTARPALAPPPAPATRTETIEFRDRQQSAIVMAFPAVPPAHADAPKLTLLSSVTSGLAGTFFAELRGRRSLAYTVFTSYSPRRESGVYLAYLASDASKEETAKQALREEILRLSGDGITAAEVDRAKKSYAGATRIALQRNGALLAELAQNHLLGLGLDATERELAAVQAVTLEELRAAAKSYLGGERYATAILRGKS